MLTVSLAKKLKGHPKGESFVVFTKTLKNGGFCIFQLHPPI